MELFSAPDWQTMFGSDTPILEIFIRGTLMYLGLFIILRVVANRLTGSLSTTDLLMIVLLADAAQNGMADDYKSVTDGLILVSTLIFWNMVLDWLGYRVKAIGRWMRPPPLILIHHGTLNRKNMRKELLTMDELMSHLREQGVETVKEVKKAFIEGDGSISIIKYDGEQSQGEDKQKAF